MAIRQTSRLDFLRPSRRWAVVSALQSIVAGRQPTHTGRPRAEASTCTRPYSVSVFFSPPLFPMFVPHGLYHKPLRCRFAFVTAHCILYSSISRSCTVLSAVQFEKCSCESDPLQSLPFTTWTPLCLLVMHLTIVSIEYSVFTERNSR